MEILDWAITLSIMESIFKVKECFYSSRVVFLKRWMFKSNKLANVATSLSIVCTEYGSDFFSVLVMPAMS